MRVTEQLNMRIFLCIFKKLSKLRRIFNQLIPIFHGKNYTGIHSFHNLHFWTKFTIPTRNRRDGGFISSVIDYVRVCEKRHFERACCPVVCSDQSDMDFLILRRKAEHESPLASGLPISFRTNLTTFLSFSTRFVPNNFTNSGKVPPKYLKNENAML